jgi:hypothetical protein
MLRLALMPLPLPLPLLVGVGVMELVEVVAVGVMPPGLLETKQGLWIKAGQTIAGMMRVPMGLVLVITKAVLPP